MNDNEGYGSLEFDLDKETADKMRAVAEECGLPYEGFLVLTATERGIRSGDLDPAEMLSAQDLLIAIAEKLDEDGDNPNAVARMADKLRALSYYATTHLVPVSPP